MYSGITIRGSEEKQRCFLGEWITSETFAGLRPVQVFHRQLEHFTPPQGLPQNQHILFRKDFSLEKTPERAILYITADDYYKLYLNGKFVTQGPCPGYPFHYYYNELDVTAYLRPGKNVVAVHTYYQGLINRVWVSGDGRHGLLLDLEADGQMLLKSDETFRWHIHGGYTSLGTTGYETQFLEQYDSSSDEDGFMEPEYDDRGWDFARKRAYQDYTLFRQPTRQLTFERIAPVSVKPIPGGLLADFGSQYVGYPMLKASGLKGSAVVLRCGQELQEDGRVQYHLRANCCYEERWLLSGKGEDTLRQYDYKSFRYLELLLPEGCQVEKSSLCVIARHHPYRQQAVCHSTQPQLQKIWELCAHSLEYGVQEVIQDCMEREKGQYLGDGCFTSLSYAVLTGDLSIMEKLIDDSLRSAFVNEGLMTCTTCSFMQEIAEYSLMLPMLLRAHYQLTGDRQFLRDRYDGICRLIRFYLEQYQTENGLLGNMDKWCVVEWPAPYRDGYDFDLTEGKVTYGVHNVINAYFLGSVKTVNAIGRLIGDAPVMEPADVARLEQVFVDAFYDRERGLFRDAPHSSHISLPSNVFPLLYDLCPDRETEKRIVELIREKRLTSAMFFVSFGVLMGLCRVGEKVLALELMADAGAWSRMLSEGCTTTIEGWGKDTKWNTSLFHLAFTYPILFLTEWGMQGLWEEQNTFDNTADENVL